MGHKRGSQNVPRGLHLGHGSYFAPIAAQHHDMCVVDHHTFRERRSYNAVPLRETLAIEAREGGMDLGRTTFASNTAPPRRSTPSVSCRPLPLRAVTCRAAFQHADSKASTFAEGGLEVITPRWHNRRLPDPLPAADSRQRRIRPLPRPRY